MGSWVLAVCHRIRIALLGSIVTVSGIMPSAQPAPVLASLAGEWRMRPDPRNEGIEAGWHLPTTDDSGWQATEVPGAYPAHADGIVWYRRRVALDDKVASAAAGGAARLRFRQVDDEASVFINGRLAIEHRIWNAPFLVPLAGFISSADREMLVVVRVVDHGGPGGILQPVEIVDASDPVSLYRTEWHERKPGSTLRQFGHHVMYCVYVRNMTPEGTFEALRARLPELKSLGVTVLWLLPIHEIGLEKRKGPDGSPYAIRDYYSVDPNLGTKEDFRRLVKDCHALGMKIIIDCVLNHMSPDSVLAREHAEWFVRDEAGRPRPEVAAWSDVVDFDWSNRAVWDYCAGAMEYWVREFDIDGYRCDVADMVPADFWRMARKRLDRIKPRGIIMLAESQQPQKHLEGFDITYNDHLWDALVGVTSGTLTATAIADAIMASQYGYPKDATRMLYIENHDKERAIRLFGGAPQARFAAAIAATLPGLPLLYTGTETGASDWRDPTFFKRSPVALHEDPHGLRAYWTSLLALRAQHPALQTGDIAVVEAAPADQVIAYERKEGDNRVLIVANASRKPVTAVVRHPLIVDGRVGLGPWQWTVFTRAGKSKP
jgi:glycosidase